MVFWVRILQLLGVAHVDKGDEQARVASRLQAAKPITTGLGQTFLKSPARYYSTTLIPTPFDMADQGLKTYRGNCHCNAHVFEARIPEIKTAYGCNCSVCVRRATLYATPLNPADITWIKGNETSMADYMFGAKTFHHKFCATCGTSLISHGVSQPEGPEKPDYGVNVRTIENIDIGKLEIDIYDGAATPPAYQAPGFTGKVPDVDVEGGKIFQGNCHCGGVRLAIKTKPLYEVNDLVQSRSGAIWARLRDEQVALSGEENLTSYIRPGSDVASERFCKVCGVPISKAATEFDGVKPGGSTEDPHGHGAAGTQAINVNVLEGVDRKQLKIRQLD